MVTLRTFQLRAAAAVLAAVLATSAVPAPASASGAHPIWYRWDQNLLELSEILGNLHYLTRICGDWRDRVWRDRMIELIEDEGASGERRDRMVLRFNQGYRGTRRWHDHCSVSARLKIEHYHVLGGELLAWFWENSPY